MYIQPRHWFKIFSIDFLYCAISTIKQILETHMLSMKPSHTAHSDYSGSNIWKESFSIWTGHSSPSTLGFNSTATLKSKGDTENTPFGFGEHLMGPIPFDMCFVHHAERMETRKQQILQQNQLRRTNISSYNKVSLVTYELIYCKTQMRDRNLKSHYTGT